MALLGVILRPLDYIRIEHPAKRTLDWTAPAVGIAFACILGWFNQLNVFAEYGLVHGINGLLQVLAGFYIAALAAVSTFDGSGRGYDMDALLQGDAASLVDPDGFEERLSRRRFLCLLFGYLALMSLALYLGGVVAMMIAPPIHEALGGLTSRSILRLCFSVAYLGSLAHVLGTTMLGLYFLSHRMVLPPATIVVSSKKEAA